MIPTSFEYERAESADHAIELLGHYEDAKILAGGQSLLSLMKQRLAQPEALVDISRIDELSYMREDGDHIAIGATTLHEDVHFDPVLTEHCGIVAHAAGEVGDPQVRHLGTIGGSVSHADPASDLPCVLRTLDADFVVRGSDGERRVAAADFFKSLFETDLGPHEVLTEVRVPKLGGAGWSYQKFHPRAQDWAIVGVAAVAREGGAAVGLTGMGETPLRATAVEEALASGSDPAAAAERASEGTRPVSDPLGSSEYRKAMAKVFARRALQEALGS
ncbi:xanthine dehydrogenase family protein subunit M [soil metagenome]